jgi:transposase
VGASEQELRQIYRQGEDACVAWMAALLERVEALEAHVGATSKNSDKPPSQDPFRNKAKGKRRRRRREHHKGGGRALIPVEDVDELVSLTPSRCHHCSLPLCESSPHVGAPGRHQQTEIPEPTAFVTEFLTHTLKCRGCGHKTPAPLPPAARSAFGPRLQALSVDLAIGRRLSTRQVKEMLLDLYGVEVSLGSICAAIVAAGDAAAPLAEEIKASIWAENSRFIDETSWRLGGARAWLWGLFGRKAAYYHADRSRSQDVARDLIPAYVEGTTHTDGYGAYNHLHPECRQVCWAHLSRHFQGHAEARDGPERAFGASGVRLSTRVCKLSREGGTPTQMRRVERDVSRLIAAGMKANVATARTLQKQRPSLLRCLYDPDVDATNNHAERMLRPAVIRRKTSFGNSSERGARAFTNILSVMTTERMQGRSPHKLIESLIRDSYASPALNLA